MEIDLDKIRRGMCEARAEMIEDAVEKAVEKVLGSGVSVEEIQERCCLVDIGNGQEEFFIDGKCIFTYRNEWKDWEWRQWIEWE